MGASVDTDELAIGSVTGEKIHAGAVGSRELGANMVGAGAVKGLTTATSSGTSISPGHAGNAEVTCPNGGMVVGGVRVGGRRVHLDHLLDPERDGSQSHLAGAGIRPG